MSCFCVRTCAGHVGARVRSADACMHADVLWGGARHMIPHRYARADIMDPQRDKCVVGWTRCWEVQYGSQNITVVGQWT